MHFDCSLECSSNSLFLVDAINKYQRLHRSYGRFLARAGPAYFRMQEFNIPNYRPSFNFRNRSLQLSLSVTLNLRNRSLPLVLSA